MPPKLKSYDSAEFLRDEGDCRIYLEEVAKDGDAAEIADAVAIVARARGIVLIAREIGLSRDELFDLLNPYGHKHDLGALLGVLDAMGVTRDAASTVQQARGNHAKKPDAA